MKFEYLKQHEAVKCGDVLIIQLGSGRYAVSGKVLNHTYNCQAPIAEGEVLQHYCGPQKTLIKIITAEGKEYTAEEYYKLNGVDIDYIYNLDEEYAHRKLLKSLDEGEKVYEETPETFTPVEITIVGEFKDTGSKYITTPLVYGNARFSSYENSFYRLDVTQLFVETVKQFAQDSDLKLEESHSWKFCKIDGQYIASSTPLEKYADKAVRMCASLEAAKDLENSIRSEINTYLRGRFNRTEMNKITAAQVFTDIESIRRRVQQLEVKQKSVSEQNSLVRKCTDLLNKLGEV